MPKIPMHRKAKRAATVLAKRTQYIRKYYQSRSYRPMYEKLKNNNSYLAKALSQEKQNCESLFSQNIALLAEVQELRLACNTRNTVISNILNNGKEILKMLVTMSGYVTNTISMCQEFSASNTNTRLSTTSVGRKESSRRMSTKSPAKGVVKPMVSGHTITKPTINLSRVNMQHINNPSRLSDIQEVSTPNRSQEMNEARSPIAVSIPIMQLRYENSHTCRMPERLAVSSSRVNNTMTNVANDEQRVRKRRSHSKRMSGSYSRSRSNRWSDENVRDSTGVHRLSSPRVKLNDVSKLLQNSQSINIRTLITNRIDNIEIQESNVDMPRDTSNRDVIAETEVSTTDEDNEMYAQTSKRGFNAQMKNSSHSLENSRISQRRETDWEDPLEGPSWLFNNTLNTSQDNKLEPNHVNISDTDNYTPPHRRNSKLTVYNDESSDIENMEKELLPNLNKCITNMETSETGLSFTASHIRNDSSLDEDIARDSFCTVLPIVTSDRERNFDNENNNKMNLTQFVTLRRNHSKDLEDQTEDFTLMLSRQPLPRQKVHNFDINELRLPVLEKSMIKSTINEVNTEMTTTATVQKITNIQIPSISNENMNETDLDPTTTIKLPLILVNDYSRISTPAEEDKHSKRKNKKAETNKLRDTDNAKNVTMFNNKAKKKSKLNFNNNQDPSTAKVILEKLDKTRVKKRSTPSPDDTRSPNTNSSTRVISNREESPQDSESNESSIASRPRRRKAPVNLKEPKLNKKLRRNC